MLSAVKSRPNFAAEQWQVVVVSDHGHVSAGGHGGQTQMERTVPIIVCSKNIVSGSMTTDSRSPAIVDVPATVYSHFGLSVNDHAGEVLGQTSISPSVRNSLIQDLVTQLSFESNAKGMGNIDGGTIHGNVNFVEGRFGLAASVDNYGDGLIRLNSDLGAAFGTSEDFALSMWVSYDSVSGDPSFFSNKDWESGNNTGINMALQTSAGVMLDINTKTNGSARQDIEPFGGFNAGEWHNLVLNVDRDSSTLLFVDGALYGEINSTAFGSYDGAFNWVLLNDGTGNYQSGSAEGLKMDEFGAWNRLLTRDEISFLSQNSIQAIPEPPLGTVILAASFLLFQIRRTKSKSLLAHLRSKVLGK